MTSSFEQDHADALLWLEPPYAEQALQWAQRATQNSIKVLQSSNRYAGLLAELTQINASAGQVSEIAFAGHLAVRLHKTASHPRGLLQTATRAKEGLGPWKTVLDVGALGASEGKDFSLYWSNASCLAHHYERCLLDLHEAGGDEAELREFDLSTGRFVEGGFALARSRYTATWVDADTLLVGHTLGDAPRTMTGHPAQALLWKRGTALEKARPVLSIPAGNAKFQALPAGHHGQAVLVQVVDYTTFVLHRVTADGSVRKLELPTALKFGFAANAQRVFAMLGSAETLNGELVPADSLIAARLDAGLGEQSSVELVYRAKPGEVVDSVFGIHVSDQSVAVPMRSGLSLWVDVARLENGQWQSRRVVEPVPGVSSSVVGSGGGVDGFVILSSGFLTPPVQEWVRSDGQRTVLERQPAQFDASGLCVELCKAKSRDGQFVEYFRVGPKQTAGKPVPTLMTGYGAFGISMGPGYFTTGFSGAAFGGATLKLWLERGGALVVPAIRGGGEYGAEWHRSAMREKRQNSYDDFHAVAESLIQGGYTDRARLGVFGTSNGGLLAAVAGTQRPDLYGAIVSDVPLADMLRFPEMGEGPAWINEYGDPKNPVDAAWLSKYSPVQNVRKGENSPAFLVTVATTDNRVGPGHARKLAKRLMDVDAKVLFLEPDGGGHSVSDSLQRPDMMAMRATFFIDTLMGPLPAAR